MIDGGGQHIKAAGTAPYTADSWFESAPGCGSLYLSSDGLILRCNAELLTWLGYERSEVEGQLRLVNMLNFGGRIFYETHISLLLNVNRRVNGISLDLLSKTGQAIPVLMNATQEQDSAGAPLYSRIVFFDTFERRSYEHELLAARQQAEIAAEELAERNVQLERAKRALAYRADQLACANEDLLQFGYAVSHDLKTPLRTLTAFSQLLQLTNGVKLDAEGAQLLDSVIKAATRMGTMLDDLMDLAKLAGAQVQFGEDISLDEVVSGVLQNLAGVIKEAQASISVDALPRVPGDKGQLVRLFQNLVGNAVKYRRQGVPLRINICAEQKGAEWMISVRDNGLGFEPEFADRVFAVFQRLHGQEIDGTGVGLTICKRIVQRLGGRIWAIGRPGEGAEFSFTIPAEMAASHLNVEADRTTALIERVTPAGKEPSPDPPPVDRHFYELFELLDLAPAMISKLDGTILVWTQSAANTFGWTRAEAVGKSSDELFKTEFPVPLAEIQGALLSKGEWAGNVKRYGRDGSAFWLASHWSLHRDGSGRPHSVIEVYSDITDLRRAESALKASSEQPDLALRSGQMGVWQWDRASGLVEWDSTLDEQLETVECRWAYQTAIQNLQTAIDNSGADVSCGPLPAVEGKESNYVQLFQNLIFNSIKYRSGAPPVIAISARKHEGQWLFSVRDNGIGIEPEYREQIFGVFKRLHGHTIPGNGIGLAICRKIVERYGGRIWVESALGQGSEFFFTIPFLKGAE